MHTESAPIEKSARRPVVALLVMIAALLTGGLIQVWPSPARAQTEGDEMELDLDDLEEPPAAAAPAAGGEGISLLDGKVRIMGRFDATYELTNPTSDDKELRKGDFKSYHHHVFVKASPSKKVGLFAEVVENLFAEISYKPFSNLELKAGKILVPFGDFSFHHYYAAVQGTPTSGILIPNIWAEYGASATWEIGNVGPVSILSETYAVKGFFENNPQKVLQLNRPALGNRIAIGERLSMRWNRILVSGSLYWDEWNAGNDLLLYGADVSLDYGLVKLPVLRDFRLKAGLARADVQNSETGDYYKYGDYVEVTYGGIREWLTPRLRYGTYIDDSRVLSVNDLHNWSAALLIPVDVLVVTAEYLWQMEEVNEVDNDLFRLMVAIDF